jgi:hypothetical protein
MTRGASLSKLSILNKYFNTNNFSKYMDNNDRKEAYTEIIMSNKWPGDPPFVITYKSGYADESLDNILHGVVTCLIGLTWSKKNIIQGMRKYIEEYDEYHKDQDTTL